eukprot:1161244-Pelagomonas_calceolata.AAC.18
MTRSGCSRAAPQLCPLTQDTEPSRLRQTLTTVLSPAAAPVAAAVQQSAQQQGGRRTPRCQQVPTEQEGSQVVERYLARYMLVCHSSCVEANQGGSKTHRC